MSPFAPERTFFRGAKDDSNVATYPTTHRQGPRDSNMNAGRLAIALAVVSLAVFCSAAPPGEKTAPADGAKAAPATTAAPKNADNTAKQGSSKPAPKYITQTLRGKVVWLG